MGLSSRTIVRRIRAWHYGAPLTRGQTIHTHIAAPEDRLLLAFVKMGGETRPWGIAWKEGKRRVETRFVPEPRTRAEVDEMAADLSEVLAHHLRHPDLTRTTPQEPADLAPLRQVWVPNQTHLDMLHHFAYTYTHRLKEREFATELRLLGRTSLFTFLESQRPGQQLAITATDALRSAYDFPAEDVRQGHLGFLLAWLDSDGDRDTAMEAAFAAERAPIATALDPEQERQDLAPLVQDYDDARDAGNERAKSRAEKAIATIIGPELERRIDLVEQAIEHIETDPRPVNPGIDELVTESVKSQWWNYVRPEVQATASGRDPFVPSAETDFQARNAAARYFRTEASEDRMFAALVHCDRELEAEAISAGRAFRGSIVDVFDEATGRKTTPVWIIEDPSPGPLSLRRGDRVCTVGHAKREGLIRNIETTKGGGIALEVEITGRKTAAKDEAWPHSMHAADDRWLGKAVTVIGTSFASMADQKAYRVSSWDALPGDWVLTAAAPVEKAAAALDEVAAE